MVSADRPCGPACRCWRLRSSRPAGRSMCGPRSTTGEIGDARGWLHPLAVARSVLIAKASAWVGALVLGWWVGGAGLSFAAPQHAAGGRRGHRGSGRGGRQRARAGGCRAMASALLQVAARAAGQRRWGDRVADPRRSSAESPKWSTREMTCGGYSRPMTDLSRGARASAQRPQAGLAAADGVAGARHRGEFRPGVHQPGGVAEARRHPGVVGRGGGGVRVGHLPQAKRYRPGQGARSQAGLRLAAGPGDLGAPGIRADGRNPTAPRADFRNTGPGRRRGRRACGPSWRRCAPIWRFCSTPTCRHRPAIETDRSRVYSDWTRDTETTGRVTASRIDSEDGEDLDANTEESPIIDVPCRTPSGRRRMGVAAELRRCAPQAVGGGAGGSAPSRRGAAARVVTTATAAVASTGLAAAHPSPNSLGSQRNRSARPPRLPNAPRAEPRARRSPNRSRSPNRNRSPNGTGRAGSGMAARARRGRVDTRRRAGQQLGVTRGAQFVGSVDGRERLRRRICRQETGTRAGCELIHRLSRLELIHRLSRRCSPRLRTAGPPFSTTRGRRSWAPACATDIGCRIRGTPAPARARAGARTAACAAGGAAAPQRRGHRRAVGCRAAGQASSHPDRRRPSQAPRRVS